LLAATGETFGIRIELMQNAWSQFLDAPAFGSALVELKSGFYPHNVIIESFMATGLPGGMAFTVLVVATSLAALRISWSNSPIAWVGLIYLQYLSGAQVSGALSTSDTMWCYMCAVIVLYSWRYSAGRSRASETSAAEHAEETTAAASADLKADGDGSSVSLDSMAKVSS
jgi:O-antigen ligase